MYDTTITDKEISKISEYIFLQSEIKKSDIAIVFGTRHKEVIDVVHRLYKQKIVPKLLISGGANRITGTNEAMNIAKNLVKLGVQKSDILLENKAKNTLENVLFSKKTIDDSLGNKTIKSILVVTKHYHARRAMMTMKKHFSSDIKLRVSPSEVYGLNKENWFDSNQGRQKVFGEMNKIEEYLKKGDIEEL